MESQLAPTIALIVTVVLSISGVILIVLGLRSPEPVLGAPAVPQTPPEHVAALSDLIRNWRNG